MTAFDGIKKCNIHGDARAVNGLINKEEIYLFDWEYRGCGEPGFDIGSYICGGQYFSGYRPLFADYRHKPTEVQKCHFYAIEWYYMRWTMLKRGNRHSKRTMISLRKEPLV